MTTERHIILVEPQIHWNTGAIGRTCLATDAYLHLIKPLGFFLDSKHVKRAGLDYWEKVNLFVWENFNEFLQGLNVQNNEIFLFSRFAKDSFWDAKWETRSFLVFGSETKGLPLSIKNDFLERQYRIPTNDKIRSLNLATSAGIALFESLRQVKNNN